MWILSNFPLEAQLTRIENLLNAILRGQTGLETHMSAIDDKLTAAEAAAKSNADAEDSAMTLLTTLVQMISDLKAGGSTDPAVLARIQALSDALSAKAAALSAAVVANTPAA